MKVYAIQSGSFIKFGVANSPESRLATVSVYCPLEPKLLAASPTMKQTEAYHLEWLIHKHCVEYRQRGEWFVQNDVTLAAAERLSSLPASDLLAYYRERVVDMSPLPRIRRSALRLS